MMVESVRSMRCGMIGSAVFWAALLLMSAAAQPAEYPVRPIRLIIPNASGGNADIVGRLLGQRLSDKLGQQVVIDNRPGASSIIGTELAARAVPDGYTVYMATNTYTTTPSLVSQKLPYDIVRDLAPVSLVGITPLILVVYPGLPVANVKDLIALAKAKPGQLNYSSTGVGTTQNLAGALLSYMTGIKIVSVPYKGVAQAITDLLGGDLQLSFPSIASVLPYVKAGTLKALGTTSLKRSQLAPALQTLSESGVPGYEASIWTGILVPAATPKNIIVKLNAVIVDVLTSNDTRERFASAGADISPSSPEEFRRFIASDFQKWATVVKSAGIKPE